MIAALLNFLLGCGCGWFACRWWTRDTRCSPSLTKRRTGWIVEPPADLPPEDVLLTEPRWFRLHHRALAHAARRGWDPLKCVKPVLPR